MEYGIIYPRMDEGSSILRVRVSVCVRVCVCVCDWLSPVHQWPSVWSRPQPAYHYGLSSAPLPQTLAWTHTRTQRDMTHTHCVRGTVATQTEGRTPCKNQGMWTQCRGVRKDWHTGGSARALKMYARCSARCTACNGVIGRRVSWAHWSAMYLGGVCRNVELLIEFVRCVCVSGTGLLGI